MVDQPDDRFRQDFRMDKPDFTRIHDMICHHPVFTNESRIPQRPAALQLAITLFCFGHNGNGASFARTSDMCGILIGAIKVCEGE